MRPERKVIPFRIPAQVASKYIKKNASRRWFVATLYRGEWTRLTHEFYASTKWARAALRLLSRPDLGKNPAIVHLKEANSPFPSKMAIAVPRSVVRSLQHCRKVYIVRAHGSGL